MSNTIPDEADNHKDSFDLSKAFKLRYSNGLSLREVGALMNVHHSVVDTRLKRITEFLPDPQELEMYRNNKSQLIEAAQYKVLNKILDAETIQNASLNNAAYTYQALYNCHRLEAGKSTSNVSMLEITGTISELQTQADNLRKSL